MGKTLRTVGTIIAGVALVATGVGALAGAGLLGAQAAAVASMSGAWTIAGVSVQTLARVGLGMAFLGSATSKPLKVGTAGGSPTDFAADPNAPIPYAMGLTGTGGRIIYATTGEAKNRNALYCTVLSGGGPIEAFVGFKANKEAVTFGSLQQAIGGTFANRMWQNNQLGYSPSEPFGPPNTLDASVLAEWTTAHRLSGYAASWYVRDSDQKVYPTGTPKPLWIIKGVKCWDPRLDDTYPGGSGSCRLADPSTWPWTENPGLHGLQWCIGRYDNGVRILGIGARLESINVPAFVEAANIADANGWKVGGVVYSTDSKWDVLKAICQAGGARPFRLSASITVLANAPRVSTGTLTEDDLAGGYSVQAVSSRRGRPNQIIPRYRSPDHEYEMVSAGPVKVADYVTRDGRLVSRKVDYPLVQDAAQVAQLAAYDLVNLREYGPVQVRLKPHWRLYKPGDCITVECPRTLAMDGQKALILGRDIDPMTGDVTLTLQSETDGKHDFALGRVADPPPVPSLHGVTLIPTAPEAGAWTAAAELLTGADGSKQPAIVVTGAADDQNAANVIVDYRQGDGEWLSAERPASAVRIEIAPVAAGATYQVRVRYRTTRGLEDPNAFLALSNVTVGALTAGDSASLGGLTADDVAKMADQLRLAQLQLLQKAVLEGRQLVDDRLTEILGVLNGRPMGPVLVEHKETIANHRVAVADNAAAIVVEAAARVTAVSTEASYRVALATDYSGFKATATSSIGTLTTNQGATAAAVNSLSTDYNGFKSTAQTTLLSHTSSIESTAASVTTLTSTVAANKASADSGLLTVTTNVSALSTSYTTLNATVGANKASADASLSVLTTNLSSTATSLTTLTTNFNGFQSSATSSLTTLSNAQSTQASQITTLQSNASGLSATVSSQGTTLVDHTNKLAVARFVLEAVASGALPARFSLYSDSQGTSAAALSAANIYFGDNTVFNDATDTLRTVTGSTASVMAWGSPFGTAADLLWWVGPSSIGLSSMSRANAYFYLAATSPFIGGTGLAAGKEVKNAGGTFAAYIGAGISWNVGAYVSLNIDSGPGSFQVAVTGVANRDATYSATAFGEWRLTHAGSTLATGVCNASINDGTSGTAFASVKKVSTSLTGPITLALEFQGSGPFGSDTGDVSGDVTIQYVKD